MIPFKSYQKTILYTILHFVVDGICACIIFSKLYTKDETTCLIVFFIYNFLAFLSQPFIGFLIDKYGHPKIFLLGSIGMLSFGYLFNFQFVLSSIFLGIGNSFFHVCGGKDISLHTKNDIVSLGIFVSTGAIGLVLGQKCYSNGLLICFFSILFLVSILLLLSKEMTKGNEEVYPMECIHFKEVLFFLLLLVIVMIRSFIGKIVIIDFDVSVPIFIGIAGAQALGKALGGVASRWLGPKKTILISIVISILCLCLGNQNPYLLCLGILMFNCSMPITLYYANQILKGKEGFAFGALAAALIPGYLLGMLEYSPLVTKLCISILSFLSAIFVIIVCKGVKKHGTS